MTGTGLQSLEERARELLVFADALDDAGLEKFAHKSRALAEEALRLAEELRVERIARQEAQEARDRALDLLADRAGQAAKDSAS
jgi:hypothetical protein